MYAFKHTTCGMTIAGAVYCWSKQGCGMRGNCSSAHSSSSKAAAVAATLSATAEAELQVSLELVAELVLRVELFKHSPTVPVVLGWAGLAKIVHWASW